MVQHDIHQMFIKHLLIHLNEAQQVEVLKSLLANMLDHPNVPKIKGSISSHKDRLTLDHSDNFGTLDLTNTVLDLANRLSQTGNTPQLSSDSLWTRLKNIFMT